MKTYYISKSLVFSIDILDAAMFIQDIAESLMLYRGLGCSEFNFNEVRPKVYNVINLTSYYNESLKEYYKYINK